MFRRKPNMEDVRTHLLGLVLAAQDVAQKQAQEIAAKEEAKYTFVLQKIDPLHLLPQARTIITYDIAKQMDKDKSHEQIEVLVNQKTLNFPKLYADLYLQVLLATVEAHLGDTFLRYSIIHAGTDFHNIQVEQLMPQGQWSEAEAEGRKALQFVQLWKYPHRNKVTSLYYLGVCIAKQNRNEEAMKLFEEGLAEYDKLDADEASEDSIKRMAEQMKQAVRK